MRPVKRWSLKLESPAALCIFQHSRQIVKPFGRASLPLPGCAKLEKGGYCQTGLHSTGLEWEHRWVNLHRSTGWLKMAVRLMVVEINWMACFQVAAVWLLVRVPELQSVSHIQRDSCSVQVPTCVPLPTGVTSHPPLTLGPIHSQLRE